MSSVHKIYENLLLIPLENLDSTVISPYSLWVFSLAYRFKDDKSELWTRRINDCKQGDSAQIEAAIKVMLVATEFIRDKIKDNTIALSAIGSSDTVLDDCSFNFKMGERISSNLYLDWRPELISKEKHIPLHGSKHSREKRDHILKNVYMSKKLPPDTKTIVIFDDLCTNGTTMKSILRSVHKSNPDREINAIGICLGKSESKSFHAKCGVEIDNSHVPSRFSELWRGAGGL